MKFLSRALEGSNLMILNTEYIAGSKDYNEPDDVLYIVYKDIDTGKKYVETIYNPKYEIWVVKPEYRTYSHMKDFEDISKCTKHLIPYKTRYAEAAKILGCKPSEAKYSNFVYQLDINIEHFYIMQFHIEYGNDLAKKLSIGFSDIESDIINFNRFADPGEAPQNAISYFNMETMTMYTLVCIQDNLPHVDENHPKYTYYEGLRSKFSEMTTHFVNHLEEFKRELHEDFDESYGQIDYQIFVFEDEVPMMKAYWEIVDYCDNDYLQFWNAPYDISNLVERLKVKGLDPDLIIRSPEFDQATVHWHEDKNPVTHKRKHTFALYRKVAVVDQMVHYAGIRSSGPKLPTTKLNAIAQKELKDTKLDYSEYGNIRMFPYLDFWKFIKYNVKDVLLQYGIEKKTHDMDAVYATFSIDCVLLNEIFTSTSVVANSLRLFAYIENHKVMGSNKNKLFKVEMTEEEKKEAKKNKYAGAWVMNPAHCSSTGFRILDQLTKYIHAHAIDMDIKSEYPSYMLVANVCNETMVGKVYLVNPDEIDIPMYDNMYLVDKDDEDGYNKTNDKSNLMVEALSEGNPTEFGRVFFKLPGFTDIADYIEDNIEDFLE